MATTVAEIKARMTGAAAVSGGLEQIGKSTERVGRQQTRLGQASASAGRQFSAQANGLGGLVQAYAGAAANVFAITAAFTALNAAARFEQIIAGTNALASSIGANGNAIIKSVNDITKAQLSLGELASTVNIGLAAGFNTQQIDDLAEVSLRASKALGRSLTDSFTRLARGAAKLEPELIDELGIFTRLDPAVRAYADSVGRSVTSLTNFERRQAFANAVIEEGQRKFRDVDTSTKTTAESLEQLSSTIVNLGLQFGALLATGIAPLADFITGSLSNSLALFGLLAKQVGGLAVTVLSAGIQSATNSLTNLAASAASSLNTVSRGFREATAAAAENARTTQLGRLGNLALREQAVEILRLVAANKLKTAEELRNAQAILVNYQATIKANIEAGKYTKNKIAAGNSVKALTVSITALNAAELASSGASNLAAVGLTKLALAVRVLGTAVNRLLGFFFTLVTVISLVQLALDALGKMFGFNVSILESITNFIANLVKQMYAAERGVKAFSSSFKDEMETAARAAGAMGEEVGEAITAAQEAIGNAGVSVFGGGRNLLSDADALTRAFRGLNEGAEQAVFEVLERRLREIGDGSVFAGRRLSQLFDLIGERSGVAAKDVSQILRGLSDFDRIGIQTLFGILVVAGVEVSKMVNGVLRFKAGFLEATSVVVQGIDKINDFNKGLLEGSLNAEKAAQAVGAIQNTIVQSMSEENSLKTQADALANILGTAGELSNEARTRLVTQLKELEESIRFLQTQREVLRVEENIAASRAARLATLEKESKLRDKIFGKSGEKLEKSLLEGSISQGGLVAQTSQEKQLNQLQAVVSQLKEAQAVSKGGTVEIFRDSDADNLIRARRELKEIEAQTAKIKDKNEVLNKLIAKGQQESEKARVVSEQINRLEDELVSLKSDDLALTSTLLQARKDERQLLNIITDLRRKFNSGLEKELQTVEKIANARDLDLAKKEISLEQQRISNAQKLLKLANDQRKASVEYTKQLNELFGTFTQSENLQFLRDKFKIEISQAEADKKAASQAAQQAFVAAEVTREAAFANIQLENTRVGANVAFLRDFAGILDQFTGDLDGVLRERVSEMAGASGSTVEVSSIRQGSAGKIVTGTNGLTNQIASTFNEAVKAAEDANEAVRTKNEEQLQFVQNSEDTKLDIIRKSQERAIRLAEIEGSVRFKVFKSFADGTNDTLKPAIEGLFQSIADGTLTTKGLTDTLNDFFKSLIENIRQKLLQETLINPISEGVTSVAKNAFFTGDSAGGSNAGSGIGDFLSGLFGGKASGGLVHMAGGGQVRDRVPAMLEPGEFVIRKPMAKAIGGPALGAMNATGTMPGGNISVNVTNTGTPQEATASPPRFDGDKMVVDIVMRDLRNNGPIRKSLRAGG